MIRQWVFLGGKRDFEAGKLLFGHNLERLERLIAEDLSQILRFLVPFENAVFETRLESSFESSHHLASQVRPTIRGEAARAAAILRRLHTEVSIGTRSDTEGVDTRYFFGSCLASKVPNSLRGANLTVSEDKDSFGLV